MVPLWIRNVLSLCNASGGRITAEEIANIAALANQYGLGCTLVSQLKRNKNVQVEVIDSAINDAGRKIKIYRITRK